MAKRQKRVFISVIEESQSVASSKEDVRTGEEFELVSYASLNKSNRLLSIVSFTKSLSELITNDEFHRYRYHLQETSNSLLQEAASVSKSLHNNGITSWFSF